MIVEYLYELISCWQRRRCSRARHNPRSAEPGVRGPRRSAPGGCSHSGSTSLEAAQVRSRAAGCSHSINDIRRGDRPHDEQRPRRTTAATTRSSLGRPTSFVDDRSQQSGLHTADSLPHCFVRNRRRCLASGVGLFVALSTSSTRHKRPSWTGPPPSRIGRSEVFLVSNYSRQCFSISA